MDTKCVKRKWMFTNLGVNMEMGQGKGNVIGGVFKEMKKFDYDPCSIKF